MVQKDEMLVKLHKRKYTRDELKKQLKNVSFDDLIRYAQAMRDYKFAVKNFNLYTGQDTPENKHALRKIIRAAYEYPCAMPETKCNKLSEKKLKKLAEKCGVNTDQSKTAICKDLNQKYAQAQEVKELVVTQVQQSRTNQLENLSKPKLIEIAKGYGKKNINKLRKDDIVQLILEHEGKVVVQQPIVILKEVIPPPPPDETLQEYITNFEKMKIPFIQNLLRIAGIDATNINDKQHLIYLLYQLDQRNAQKCDPSKKINCQDGQACDISSSPGICVPPNDQPNLTQIIYENQKLVGTRENIENLQKILNIPVEKVPEVPVPEVLKVPVTEVLKVPVPEVLKVPVPEVLKVPVPEVLKVPEVPEVPVPEIPAGPVCIEEKMKHTIAELRSELKSMGATPRPDTLRKPHLAELACQLQENQQLCPDNICPGNMACDISTNPGICIDQSMVDQVQQPPLQHNVWNYQGHTIVGSDKAIQQLKEKLRTRPPELEVIEEVKLPPPMPSMPSIPSMPSMPPSEEKKEREEEEEKEEEGIEIDEQELLQEIMEEEKKPEVEDEVRIEQLQQTLSNIISEKKVQLEDFTEVQKSILQCLGVLGA